MMGASVFDAYTDGGCHRPDRYHGTATNECDFSKPGPASVTFKMVSGNDNCKAISFS